MKASVLSRSASRSAAVVALAVAGLLPLFSGCTTTTPGPGGVGVVAYGHGELSTDVTRDLDAVFGAAQRALRQLEIVKIDDQRTRIDARILSRTARGPAVPGDRHVDQGGDQGGAGGRRNPFPPHPGPALCRAEIIAARALVTV